MQLRFVAGCLLSAIAWCGSLSAQSSPARPEVGRCFAMELYASAADADSPTVTQARELIGRRSGVTCRVVRIDENVANRTRYEQICKALKLTPTGRPLLYGCGQSGEVPRTPQEVEATLDRLLTMTVFKRQGCPHCAALDRYLEDLLPRFPALSVVRRELTLDKTAAADLERLAARYQKRAVSVPVVHFFNTLQVGFDTASTTSRSIEATLQRWTVPCPLARTSQRADAHRRLVSYHAESGTLAEADRLDRAARPESPPPAPLEASEELLPLDAEAAPGGEVAAETIDLPLFGRIDAHSLGLPLFTLAVGLVDGFNPCAMWVLLFLLSILVNLRDRRKILAVAGTFVVISGAAYFAFMAAWLSVFRWIGLLRPAQVTLGALAVAIGCVHVKDFFAFHRGLSLSIPESAKPAIYSRVRRIVTAEHLTAAILGAAILAILVNVIELLCTAGLPALYTQILAMRQLPAWKEYGYLSLYIAAYMLDDTLMVAAVVLTLGKRKLQEREGRWLKLVSGLVILILGLLMIFRPDWLV